MSGSYDEDAYREGYPKGIESHFWHIARNDMLQRLLRDLVTGDTLVLDVGCGMGVATAHMRANGFNCVGVEVGSAPVAENVRDHVHTDTSVFELPEELRQRVGVVLLLDVLEHIEERQQFLVQLRQSLPNCKHLVITVPARQELWSNYDDYWGHQLRYSRFQLQEELLTTGYQPVKLRYLFHSIYWLALLMNTLGIERGVQFRSPTRTRVVLFLHRVLGAWASIENRFLPGSLVGSSLLCVAERGAIERPTP